MAISTGAAILGSAVIGAGAGIYGASKTASAAKDAAAQSDATQRYIYDTTREDQRDWRDIGKGGIGLLAQGFGISLPGQMDWSQYGAANPDVQAEWQRLVQDGTAYDQFGNDPSKFYEWHYNQTGKAEGRAAPPATGGAGAAGGSQVPNFLDTFSEEDFRADPGYQFRLSEGLKAVQGSAAAGGGLKSGGTLKALTRYAQGTADQTYQDAYNRFNNDRTTIYNRLANLAGMGQTANNALASAGQNYANAVGNNAWGRAAGTASAANQMAGAVSGLGQNILGQWNGYQQPGLLNANAFMGSGGFNNAATGYGGAGQDISSLDGLF